MPRAAAWRTSPSSRSRPTRCSSSSAPHGAALGRHLPTFYVEGFVDPDERGEARVWVHRPVIGTFQSVPVEPLAGQRHFNEASDPLPDRCADLERLLAGVEDAAARIVREVLPRRAPLAASDRDVLATLFALLGIRLSSGFRDLDEAEARRGYDELLQVLREMGWVFWEAGAPDYFVSSSAPFHVAFPEDEGLVQTMGLHAPQVEMTLPLTPRLALHATWKRRGELWRRASEDVLLELNARTIFRAREFVLAPKPAIPG